MDSTKNDPKTGLINLKPILSITFRLGLVWKRLNGFEDCGYGVGSPVF